MPFSRGQLYLMLKCRTFLGEIDHKGVVYPGLHEGIVSREQWNAVQAMLSANLRGERSGSYARSPSLLAGLITDGDGTPLASTHASKGRVRYRYYTSAETNAAGAPLRIPAREIEAAVAERVAHMFDDPLELAAAGWLKVPSDRYAEVTTRIGALAARARQRQRDLLRSIVTRVQVQRSGVSIHIATAAVAAALDLALAPEAAATLTLTYEVRLTRTGMAMRLVHDSGAATGTTPERSMSRLLAQAHHYWRELRKGELDIKTLAAREGVSASWVTRTLRLAFLSPEVSSAILTGKQRSGIDLRALTGTDTIMPLWTEQAAVFLPHQQTPKTIRRTA